jgi:two-component system nitrogen regulation response regulator GlnG
VADVWIADDDAAIRFVLCRALHDAGANVHEFADAETLVTALNENTPDVVITDVRMPGAGGLKLLELLKARGVAAPVIVMSAFTDIAATAAAYRHGAFDYLPKPFDLDKMMAAVDRALAEVRPPPAPLPQHEPESELIGHAPMMRELFRNIGRVSATDLNVLVTGATGTGKELVARA